MANFKLCSVPNCGKPVNARGLCNSHYARFQRYGNPTVFVLKTPRGEPLRFLKGTAFPYAGKDCLIWPYADDGRGYGVINFGGKVRPVHRLVCEAVHGSPPSDLHQAAHNCGNGHLGCCNPHHLEWKTRPENEADKLVHGTSNRGEQHGMSKLTDDEAREILSLKGKMLQREIAERFRVSKAQVGKIHRREAWTWLVA